MSIVEKMQTRRERFRSHLEQLHGHIQDMEKLVEQKEQNGENLKELLNRVEEEEF